MDDERYRSLSARAKLHAALSDPARLAIVERLLLGDASPSELGHELRLTSNLLAHHTNLLKTTGVIERSRSQGDHRRTYFRLQSEVLDGLTPRSLRPAARVVFVCARNSARSPLAAALWSRRSAVLADSAGTHPADRVHPLALNAAQRHGIPLATSATRRLAEVLRPGDLVVAVCDEAHESLALDNRLHWSIPDPVRIGTDAAFDEAIRRLTDRIDRLSAAVQPPVPDRP